MENRRYIKDLLVTHPLWKDGNFWEQVLWQCAIEQVSRCLKFLTKRLLFQCKSSRGVQLGDVSGPPILLEYWSHCLDTPRHFSDLLTC